MTTISLGSASWSRGALSAARMSDVFIGLVRTWQRKATTFQDCNIPLSAVLNLLHSFCTKNSEPISTNACPFSAAYLQKATLHKNTLTEWKISIDHCVKQHPKSPHINFITILLLQKDFRSLELVSAQIGPLCILNQLAKSKISQFEYIFAILLLHQNVLSFYIPVQVVLPVQILQPSDHVSQNLSSLVQRKHPVHKIALVVWQIPSLAKLKQHVDKIFVLLGVVQFGEIRGIYRFHAVDLPRKIFLEYGHLNKLILRY